MEILFSANLAKYLRTAILWTYLGILFVTHIILWGIADIFILTSCIVIPLDQRKMKVIYESNDPVGKEFKSQNHCVRSVHILNFYGRYFPAFGLNTERYSISLRIQCKCGKMQTRKTANTDNVYAVKCLNHLRLVHDFFALWKHQENWSFPMFSGFKKWNISTYWV